jgi:hypothetical protein
MAKKPLFIAFLALLAVTLTAAVAISTSEAVADDPPTFAMSLDQLQALNPAVVAHYGQISPCVPHMGVHYAAVVDGRPAMAPSVVLVVDPVNGNLTAMEILVPSDMPWQPWYDQPEGEPLVLGPGMSLWTQHVYLVDHAEINECPPVEE